MQRDSLISVIVPVYRVEQYLSRCVDSILAQTYENLEVILVDDGSPDGSGAMCDAYAEKDPRVRVVHKENGGLSSARNAGIDVAAGEYLTFVDSDDWIEPDAYENMLALMKKYEARLVCGGRYDISERTGQQKQGLCPKKEELISGEEMAGRIFTWDGCDSSACDKLYHRSLFREFRYPFGKVCEDVPVTYRIVLEAGQVALYPRPMYNYFHRAGSITTSSLSEKTFHFAQHAEKIHAYICRNHPAIEPQARYLRARALMHSLLQLDLAETKQRQQFASQERTLRRQLRGEFRFLLTSPHFGRQERLTALLLAVNWYRPLRRLYHRLKG